MDQGNGNYASTPFNVKFGKLKFLNASEEIFSESIYIIELYSIAYKRIINYQKD